MRVNRMEVMLKCYNYVTIRFSGWIENPSIPLPAKAGQERQDLAEFIPHLLRAQKSVKNPSLKRN